MSGATDGAELLRGSAPCNADRQQEAHARLIANARLIAEMWALVHAVERGLREVGESDFVNSEYVALEQLDGPIKEAFGKLLAALNRLDEKAKPKGGA